MGYFDRLTDMQFRRDADNTWIYYPSGFRSKGRRIDTEDEKQRIYASHRRTLKLVLPASIIGGVAIGLAGLPVRLLILLITFLLLCGLNHWRKYRHLPYSGHRMGFEEAAINGARAFPDWYYRLLGGLSAVMLSMALIFLILFEVSDSERMHFVIIPAGSGIFGIALSVFLYRLKRRRDRSE